MEVKDNPAYLTVQHERSQHRSFVTASENIPSGGEHFAKIDEPCAIQANPSYQLHYVKARAAPNVATHQEVKEGLQCKRNDTDTAGYSAFTKSEEHEYEELSVL